MDTVKDHEFYKGLAKAIETYMKYRDPGYNEPFVLRMSRSGTEALLRLLETQEQKWISVEDKLPDKDGKYLVTITSNVVGKPFVKTAYFLANLCDNWAFKYDGEPNMPGFYNGDGEGDWVERSVTHWMPLPEPPEERSAT